MSFGEVLVNLVINILYINFYLSFSRIKVVQNDRQDWDELFYDLSRDRLGGVMVTPIDCVAYYVKRRGKYGVVYTGKNTGFAYNIGVHYPKTTPLQEPFDTWILRLHATGMVRYWTEEFRDNRYWTNAKEDPEPASLKWNQISGGFALCGALLVLASFVFFGEMIHYRLRYSNSLLNRMPLMENPRTKPKKVA